MDGINKEPTNKRPFPKPPSFLSSSSYTDTRCAPGSRPGRGGGRRAPARSSAWRPSRRPLVFGVWGCWGGGCECVCVVECVGVYECTPLVRLAQQQPAASKQTHTRTHRGVGPLLANHTPSTPLPTRRRQHMRGGATTTRGIDRRAPTDGGGEDGALLPQHLLPPLLLHLQQRRHGLSVLLSRGSSVSPHRLLSHRTTPHRQDTRRSHHSLTSGGSTTRHRARASRFVTGCLWWGDWIWTD